MRSWQTSSTPGRDGRIFLTAAVLLILVCLASLCLGAVSLGPGKVLSALRAGTGDESLAGRILWYSRLPRLLAALLTGACLAVSGVLVQGVLDNPLAAPNVIGVNAGAGLAVTLAGALIPSLAGQTAPAAFAGALAAALLVAVLGEATGASRLTLVLSGVMLSGLLNAATEGILSFVPDALSGYADFRLGSFAGVTMSDLPPVACTAAVGLPLALLLSRPLELLSLGGDRAASLGVRIRPLRLGLLILAAALAGVSVSVAGLLGFVGLIVPHMARVLVGQRTGRLLVLSALGGALLTSLCDLLARTLFAPHELPVGVVLSFVGTPFFLWQLFHAKGGHRHAGI